MNAAQHLQELQARRQEWVDTTRDNGFEDGIRTLLTELYPDEAHFIYELLQNAEDAGASSVSFQLDQAKLVVTHDGRCFDHEDVESITKIGVSTKKDDVNQIGKFGVGFKAVFAYTETPLIFSGDYAFEIRDLVCPVPVPTPTGPVGTRFEFPFNHPGKPAERAYEETARGLESLAAETLLFLDHVREVTWCVEEQNAYGQLIREAESGNRVRILRHAMGMEQAASTNWLRFQSGVEGVRKRNVAIAFRLDETPRGPTLELNDPGEPAVTSTRIARIEGRLFIFFPADKESTRLGFHVHGPFASTVARDSIIHGRADNQHLLAVVADLLATALPQIRDMGLLTTEFLGVLPNSEDGLAAFFEPIRTTVTALMQREPLVPAHGGGHASARGLIQGPRPIKDVITAEDLPFFVLRPAGARWAAGAMENRRESRFLMDLGILTWSWGELQSALVSRFSYNVSVAAKEWLSSRSDDWMHRLYDLLVRAPSQQMSIYSLKSCHIVRLVSGEHVRGRDAYFPPDEGARRFSDLPCVAPSVLRSKSKERAERVRDLLSRLEVKTAGEREVITALLDRYYRQATPGPPERHHLAHLRRFAEWWRKSRDTTPFANSFIFRGGDAGDYHQAGDLYVDRPLEETGLEALLKGSGKWVPLWPGYAESRIAHLLDFASAAGVRRSLQIVESRIGSGHPDHIYLRQDNWTIRSSHLGIDVDYTIPRLAEYLAKKTVAASWCIWGTVLAAAKNQQQARLRRNGSSTLRTRPSSLVYQLRAARWVPDAHGEFHRPVDLAVDDLHPDFSREDPHGWLAVLGFGEAARNRQQEYQARRDAAATLGVSVELAERLAGLPREGRDELVGDFLEYLDRRKRPVFPEREPANRERRATKVAAAAEEAPSVEYEHRSRSVRISNGPSKTEARAYLADLYTNDEGIMICQVCEGEMPFKLANGEYYFEAVEFLDLDREHRENHLALCPTCAAMFQYARSSTDDELREAVLEGEEFSVAVILAGRGSTLRFVGTHIEDLRALLGAAVGA